jgi:hypothetical protein
MKLHALLGLLAAAAALGCNQNPGAGNGDEQYAPMPCPDCPMPTAGYPAGPYGFGKGDTIKNLSFSGFIDAQAQSTTLDTISLGDFYNPTGDDVFLPDSPYGPGTKKPTALLIDIGSGWCGPCREEAKSLLNDKYATYKPCGGEFLSQLAEGGTPGAPVDQTILQAWVTGFHVAYPATIDGSKQLYPFYSSGSFPDSAIVDTRTMKIVEVVSGPLPTSFWSDYESLLDAKCLAGQ